MPFLPRFTHSICARLQIMQMQKLTASPALQPQLLLTWTLLGRWSPVQHWDLTNTHIQIYTYLSVYARPGKCRISVRSVMMAHQRARVNANKLSSVWLMLNGSVNWNGPRSVRMGGAKIKRRETAWRDHIVRLYANEIVIDLPEICAVKCNRRQRDARARGHNSRGTISNILLLSLCSLASN